MGSEKIHILLRPQQVRDLRYNAMVVVTVDEVRYKLHLLGSDPRLPDPEMVPVGLPADAVDELVDLGCVEWQPWDDDSVTYVISRRGVSGTFMNQWHSHTT